MERDIDLRKAEYDKFYIEYNVDKDKLIEKHEGYVCVCCYCLKFTECYESLRVKGWVDREYRTISLPRPECCKTGIPCKNFIADDESLAKEPQLAKSLIKEKVI